MTRVGAQNVIVRDISRSGALLAVTERIPLDSDAIFKRGSLFVAGRIAWCDEHEAGLHFYRELTLDEVDAAFHAKVFRVAV